MFKKEDRRQILRTMQMDSEFLKKHNLMDYSLLFAVENQTSDEKIVEKVLDTRSEFSTTIKGAPRNHIYNSNNDQYHYHMAIIDYL